MQKSIVFLFFIEQALYEREKEEKCNALFYVLLVAWNANVYIPFDLLLTAIVNLTFTVREYNPIQNVIRKEIVNE